MEAIREINLTRDDITKFTTCYSSCLIINNDQKMLLQKRGEDWPNFPGVISTFGGKIEDGENPMQALLRELKEELDVEVMEKEVISLGAITEAITNYSELVYVYFWRDTHNIITNCYEGELIYYSHAEVLTKPKVMDYVSWMMRECLKKGLLRY